MFGSKKNKALVASIVEATAPVVAMVQNRHGVPLGFWDDAYALGFVMGRVNALMGVHAEGLGVEDKGRVLVDALGALSGLKGKPLSETCMVLAAHQDADFLRASQNGMFIVMVEAGRVADDHPALAAARAALSGEGTEPSPAATAERLLRDAWVAEIRDRLAIGA